MGPRSPHISHLQGKAGGGGVLSCLVPEVPSIKVMFPVFQFSHVCFHLLKKMKYSHQPVTGND